MHLSQSALTKSLRELEEDVGEELMTRSYKGIEFTPAGSMLLSHARLALSILDKAAREIRLLRGGAGARVVLAVTPMAGAVALPRVLREYEKLCPDAEVHLTEGLLSQVLPDLIEGRLDFAIAVADPAGLLRDGLMTAEGVVKGAILDAPRGTGGFGYDPLFFCPELGQTFAEAGIGPKGQLSHRARAFAALFPHLRAYLAIEQ